MCINLMDTELTKYVEEVYECLPSDIKINYSQNKINIKIKNKEVDINKLWKCIKNKYNIKESEETPLFVYVQTSKPIECEYVKCTYQPYRYDMC